MLRYLSKSDIVNASDGSYSCPLAQMLDRVEPPPPGACWSVGSYTAGLRAPGGTIRTYRLGKAAQKVVRAFDNATTHAPLLTQVPPRHVRLYLVKE